MLLAGLLGLGVGEVRWLFRTLLPRLVAHEIGHALQDEAGLMQQDVRHKEQVAERLAQLRSRPHLGAADRDRDRALLREAVAHLGGVELAAGLHRHAARVCRQLGLAPEPAALQRARSQLQRARSQLQRARSQLQRAGSQLQRDYHRDLRGYVALSVAWVWIDLYLDDAQQEDSLDAFCRDHLTLAH